MWERIREMIIKELKQTLREPKLRATLFVPPLLQLLVFGYAVNLDVEHATLAWMDQDNSVESRELLQEFTGSGRFTILRQLHSEEDTQRTLDSSEVESVVRILPGFAADLARGRAAAVQVLVDGSNSNTASLVAAQCTQVIQRFST